MTSFALETATTAEVIAAYSTGKQTIPAVGSGVTDGWFVVGMFSPHLSALCRVQAYGFVTDDATLSLQVRLFDVQAAVALGGTATITSEVPMVTLGTAEVTIIAGKVYQVQARCLSSQAAPAVSKFAVLETATVTD